MKFDCHIAVTVGASAQQRYLIINKLKGTCVISSHSCFLSLNAANANIMEKICHRCFLSLNAANVNIVEKICHR